MPFYSVPFYKSFFTKCLFTKAFLSSAFLIRSFLLTRWTQKSSILCKISVDVNIIRRSIFPSYFEYFLRSAFLQSAFLSSAFLNRSFLLTRWTQKSSILCKISVDVIIIRRTIFPSTPIIMCESVSVFLSCKSKYGYLLHKLALSKTK